MKRIYESLFKPRKIVSYLNKASKKYLLYLFLIPLMLLIPLILTATININKYWPDVNDYMVVFNEADVSEFKIVDNILITENKRSVVYGDILINFNDNTTSYFTKFQIVFDKTEIKYYILERLAYRFTYQELGISDLEFNNGNDLRALSVIMQDILINHKLFLVADLVIFGVLFILDYLMIVFLFTFIGSIYTKIKLPFELRFRLSTYLSTGYLLATLILSLLSFNTIIIPIVVSYIYHIYVYRSLRITKVNLSKGAKLDE